MINLPPVPPYVKNVSHFLKVADEHDDRNPVISYWCRMHACQAAMKAVPGKKPPELTALLIAIMDWLEHSKKAHADTDGFTNETAAQALLEEYAIQLFQYADAQDQAENFGKNMVKAFYTAGILMDALEQFGPLSEDLVSKRRYAKWKAAYVHNCLRNGDKPVSGPPVERNLLGDDDEEDDDDEDEEEHPTPGPTPGGPAQPTNPSLPPMDPFTPFDPAPSSTSSANPSVPFIPQPTYTPQPVPQPAPRNNPVAPTPAPPANGASLGPEQIEKAQKYCKWAGSALAYDDVNTAIDNLQKALHLLQFGEEK